MYVQEISLGIFVLCLVLSHSLRHKAMQQLTPEEKQQMFQVFNRLRSYSVVSLLSIVLLFSILFQILKLSPQTLLIIYVIALALHVTLYQVACLYKFRQLPINQKYATQFVLSRFLTYLGVGIVIVTFYLTQP